MVHDSCQAFADQGTSRPALQLVLAAAAALLAAVARGAAAATCAVEAGCGAGAACLSGFSHAASEFPYTVDYTTTGDANSTTFIFKVWAAAAWKLASCQALLQPCDRPPLPHASPGRLIEGA